MGQNKVRSGARKETNGSGRKIKGKVRGNWEVRRGCEVLHCYRCHFLYELVQNST